MHRVLHRCCKHWKRFNTLSLVRVLSAVEVTAAETNFETYLLSPAPQALPHCISLFAYPASLPLLQHHKRSMREREAVRAALAALAEVLFRSLEPPAALIAAVSGNESYAIANGSRGSAASACEASLEPAVAAMVEGAGRAGTLARFYRASGAELAPAVEEAAEMLDSDYVPPLARRVLVGSVKRILERCFLVAIVSCNVLLSLPSAGRCIV